jgi:iron complex transport system substrate-binding protein
VRRSVLLVLLLAAAVSGCQESGFDESKETARPLKVQHALGDIGGTKVPGQASRVATLTIDSLGDALALGVRPVWASAPGAEVPAYLRAKTAGLDIAPPVTKLDLAALEATNPGVILASVQGQKTLYPDLSRIAPTIATDASGGGWQLNLRLHGEALGRTNDAELLLTDWDRRVAATRDAIGVESAEATTVAVVLVTRNGLFVAGADSFAARVLADLGTERGAWQNRPGERVRIRSEDMARLNADLILLSVAPGADAAGERLARSPGWRRLGAVRSGSVERVDAGTWWSGGGILAARAALGDLERAL